MPTNTEVELDTATICPEIFHAHLTPTARLILIYAMNNRDARIAGINSKTVSRWLRITPYAAQKALKELRRHGLADFRVTNNAGQLFHEWTFRWPTIEEMKKLCTKPVGK